MFSNEVFSPQCPVVPCLPPTLHTIPGSSLLINEAKIPSHGLHSVQIIQLEGEGLASYMDKPIMFLVDITLYCFIAVRDVIQL